MDIVFIEDLKIETVIGVFAWERKIRQLVSFDIEMFGDISAAAVKDSIDDAIDYNAVCKGVIHLVENSRDRLVETLAERVAQYILTEFSVSKIKLKLTKINAVKEAKAVGVLIQRTANDCREKF